MALAPNAPVDPTLPISAQPADTPADGRELNRGAIMVLRRRCREARAQGATNIAINANLLIELFDGVEEAMVKADYKPRVRV